MITKLAVTSTRVRASVRIGSDEFGSTVAVEVDLNRKSDEVADAMSPLENLVLRTAQTHVRSARDRREIEQLAEQMVGKQLERERKRLTKDAQAGSERKLRDADQKVSAAESKLINREQEIARLSDVVDKQRKELFALRNPGVEQQ